MKIKKFNEKLKDLYWIVHETLTTSASEPDTIHGIFETKESAENYVLNFVNNEITENGQLDEDEIDDGDIIISVDKAIEYYRYVYEGELHINTAVIMEHEELDDRLKRLKEAEKFNM